jgi:hypothetical protein
MLSSSISLSASNTCFAKTPLRSPVGHCWTSAVSAGAHPIVLLFAVSLPFICPLCCFTVTLHFPFRTSQTSRFHALLLIYKSHLPASHCDTSLLLVIPTTRGTLLLYLLWVYVVLTHTSTHLIVISHANCLTKNESQIIYNFIIRHISTHLYRCIIHWFATLARA